MEKDGMRGIPEQYNRLKADCDGYILLMQVGNFLVLFGDDAQLMAKCCQVKLTPSGSMDNPVAKAGVPLVAVDKYVGRLLRSGYKVAIALQKEDENGSMSRVITERIEAVRRLSEGKDDER